VTEFHCPRCGADFTWETEAAEVRCPLCRAIFPTGFHPPATGSEDVIDVTAQPVGPHGPGADPGPRPGPDFARTRVRIFKYDRQGPEGTGCCCLGCLGAGFLLLLLVRGLLSLLGLV